MTVNSLPGGTYLLAIYMHSTVTNTFNAVRTVDIKVSTPVMAVGTQSGPLHGTGFFVGGWSLDLAAPSGSGSGVDAIHTWAYPVINGVIGAPIWIGVANYGVSRPDVAAIFGPQFQNSGFDFTAVSQPGTYFLAVFSHSSVTGTFNALRVLTITVVHSCRPRRRDRRGRRHRPRDRPRNSPRADARSACSNAIPRAAWRRARTTAASSTPGSTTRQAR
jgi:hypothetical protein